MMQTHLSIELEEIRKLILIYEYKNDCLTASIQYNKDYYSDNELKPTEEIFFSISIVPLATVNTPSAR